MLGALAPSTAYASPATPLLLAGAELPESPSPQGSVAATLGSIAGVVQDRDGNSIAAALVALLRDGQAPLEVRTTPDGRFTLLNLAPGPYKLSISAPGFAAQSATGVLRTGETLSLTGITLSASSTSEVQVTATQADIAQAQIQAAEQQRVLGVLPNFYVSYDAHPAPLSSRQKLELGYKTLLDPTTFVAAGVVAGIQQGTNTYPSWGQDAGAYGKRYAAAYGTFLTGTLLGNALLPVILKQDPRYFVKGTGSTRSRILYALANAVICKGDSMRWQPNYSSILGNLAASGIANFYYPAADRQGAQATFEGAAIGIGATGFANLMQEFVVRRLTPHAPKQAAPAAAPAATPAGLPATP